jgi:hypothetical protein
MESQTKPVCTKEVAVGGALQKVFPLLGHYKTMIADPWRITKFRTIFFL